MLRDLIAILAEYGIVSTLSVISLIIIIKALKKAYDNYNPHSQYMALRDARDRRKVDLSKHDFFDNIEFKVNVDFPIESFSQDPNRNVLYRDIMMNLFSTYHDIMLSFVARVDESWTADEWKNKLVQEHYLLIEEFISRCNREGVPEVAVRLFMEWYTPYIHKIYKYINSVSKLPDTNNIVERTRFFLLVLELILVNVTADAQKFKILNGQLNGIVYKDMTL